MSDWIRETGAGWRWLGGPAKAPSRPVADSAAPAPTSGAPARPGPVACQPGRPVGAQCGTGWRAARMVFIVDRHRCDVAGAPVGWAAYRCDGPDWYRHSPPWVYPFGCSP